MTRFKLKTMQIMDIARYYKNNKFIYNPEYQRSEVWENKNKQKLIDSILRGYSIGVMFFRPKVNGKIEVLDGQQRIRAIGEFVHNNLKTSRSYSHDFYRKGFADLKSETKRYMKFKKYKIYYFQVENDSDQITSDIFIRLQEGKPLNSAEKLNALRGDMRDFVYQMSQHGFFNIVEIPKKRFGIRFVCVQIAYLEKYSRVDDLFFPRPSYGNLRNFYITWESRLPKSCNRKINSVIYATINFLSTTLKKDARLIRNSGDLLTVYLLASNLIKKYPIRQKEKSAFRHFIIDFFSRVAEVRTKETKNLKPDDPINKYVFSIGLGLTSENLKIRYEIISSEFFSRMPKLVEKDPKEDFDINQKIAIFYKKDNRLCQYCKNEVSWDDKAFHHIKPHGDGGPTTIENGQLMHVRCHEELHKKSGSYNE